MQLELSTFNAANDARSSDKGDLGERGSNDGARCGADGDDADCVAAARDDGVLMGGGCCFDGA